MQLQLVAELPAPPETPAERTAVRCWLRLEEHLQEWFHAPDCEALRATLAACLAHRHRDEDPVWLFVLGQSGSGKTSLVINTLGVFPNVHQLDDISSNTLLSGFQPKGRSHSYLHTHIGDSGIILIPDFSTITSKRHEEKGEIAAQLRKLYDGDLTKARGSLVETPEWHGKCTIIAAGTLAVERQWGLLREVGERFMQVRWRSGDAIEVARAAHKQIGNERAIKSRMMELMGELLSHQPLGCAPKSFDLDLTGILHLGKLVAWLRQSVVRDTGFNRQIIEVSPPELPTRIQKALSQIARAHADMFRREIIAADIAVAQRVAVDTMPLGRWGIVCALDDGMECSFGELLRATSLPKATLHWQLEELQAMRMLEVRDIGELYYRLTDEFLELKERARL